MLSSDLIAYLQKELVVSGRWLGDQKLFHYEYPEDSLSTYLCLEA